MASKTDSDIVFFTQGSALSKNIVKYANKYDTDFYVMTGPGGTLAHGVSNEVMSSQSKAIFDPKNYEFNNFEYYFKDNKGKLYGETQHDLGQPYLNVVIKKYNHETHEYENISNEEMQGVLSKNLVSDLKNELFKTNKTYNTNNEYDKYTISTKYQSVNDGINGIIGVLNNSFYTPSNPTFKNNQLLTSRINGIISTVSTSSNIILNDTGNIANLFGGLLQNYSYLENELSKDVNDIGVLASDLVYLSSDIKDYNPYILVFSNDEYKFDINEKVIEGKIGSLSVNEIDNLLSNSGVVNSLFNNEIENSTLLIKQIDELINSEINGPAWNEAKSLLICLKKNHEIRIRSAKYLKGELTNILQNLKNYIEPDSEITDENLNELENKISSLENEIHSLESQVSYMDDYVYYEDKYGIHKEGNPHKAQMQALIREKYNQLSSLRQIVNRIKGYCNLMNISINSINNLYNEVETSSSYYGGLVQIPNINAKDLDTLSIYRNNR